MSHNRQDLTSSQNGRRNETFPWIHSCQDSDIKALTVLSQQSLWVCWCVCDPEMLQKPIKEVLTQTQSLSSQALRQSLRYKTFRWTWTHTKRSWNHTNLNANAGGGWGGGRSIKRWCSCGDQCWDCSVQREKVQLLILDVGNIVVGDIRLACDISKLAPDLGNKTSRRCWRFFYIMLPRHTSTAGTSPMMLL